MNESLVRVSLRDLRRVLVGKDYPPVPGPGIRRPRLRRLWSRWRSLVVPLLLLGVLGLGAAAMEYLADTYHHTRLVALLIGYGTTLPVLLAYHRPLTAWRIAYVMLFVGVLGAPSTQTWPWNPAQIVFFLVIQLALALRADSGVAAWAGLLTLAPVFLFVDNANAWGVSVLFLLMLILGNQIRRWRVSQAELSERLAEQEERSELEQARRAVLEERTRIAREMHDVVAHHMSMIAVQAETAPFRLADLDEPVRLEFASIAGSAREAMTDMRRLLGVLRSETAPALTAPQPGLAEVAELVETARRAGVPVSLHGTAPDAEGPVALAAYRIVQEALANAARHAPGASVRVAVTHDGEAVAVRVENDAPAGDDPAAPAQRDDAEVPAGAIEGHGIAGMRERATLLGGTFEAGPTVFGGFAVAATLPAALRAAAPEGQAA
ncbi:sensor histidine kinase [Asanoa ishikariensis]|uniref:sensor histidine kinase n=1 Tax=Asanoa ishikariensis TaxID=137265 RepID=UPI001EF3C25E|nr:histidine kinase [Asanoa ishikariensis]